MAQTDTRLEFAGPAVDDGQMDARWVGQTLVAFSDLLILIKASDQDLRNALPPTVKVTSFSEGSFDINLVVEALGDFWEQYRTLMNGDEATALANTVGILGLVVGGLKVFGRRRVKSQSSSETGDRVTIEFEGEPARWIASPEAAAAFVTPEVRRAARRMVEPLERGGVNSLRITVPGTDVTVAKSEVENFHAEDPTLPDDTVQRRTTRVQPVSVNFDSESWRVTEGAARFTAKVEDKAFLQLLDDGTTAIGKTDTFEVGLRVEQYTDDNGKLKARHAIERVISHERGAVQPAIEFGDGPDSEA